MAVSAMVWIRDGVLVNRMHVNPAAFALVYHLYTTPTSSYRAPTLGELVNFAFEKSGFSCAEKILLFDQVLSSEIKRRPDELDTMVAFYNDLATRMAVSCNFFTGAPELIKELHGKGVLNFITSAVEQPVLDIWAFSKGGCQISPFIEGVLGKRPNFVKGRDHFAYISRTVDGATIYFIADAPSELSMARSLSAEYKIVPIGFAYSVQRDDVLEALSQGQLLLKSASGWQLKPPRLLTETISVPPQSIELPGAAQDLASTLLAAGGDFVVRGDAQVIMSNLKDLLETIT